MKEPRQDGIYWTDFTLYRYTPLEPNAVWGFGSFEQYRGAERGREGVVPSEDDFWRMTRVPAADLEDRIAQVDTAVRTASRAGAPLVAES